MSVTAELKSPPTKEQEILSLPQGFFPDFLRRSQNADGGWGYRPGFQSTTEPTAWAILALQPHEAPSSKVLTLASDWLLRAQMASSAWPTRSGKDPGCWVTALACLALLNLSTPAEAAISRGARWLCETWPAEGNFLWRMRQRWQPGVETVVRQNHALRGWGWIPNTASWVEPTAYALILLQNIPEDLRPPQASERIQLGEKMLYDRACPGGGWNAGNPLVYGVPGVPRMGPTVWALLALRHHKERAANAEALAWLDQHSKTIQSPGSLALAQLCLRVYGRTTLPIETELSHLYHNNQFLQSIPVAAWASLALGSLPGWLEGSSQTRGKI